MVVSPHIMTTSNQWNGREGYSPRYIILHGTAGGSDAFAIARYFQSTQGEDEPVSSNDIIGQDGTLVSLVPASCAAYANGVLEAGHDPWWSSSVNPNLITISIETCNPSIENADSLTAAQQATLFARVKQHCEDWGIPKRKADAQGGITGHFSISPQSRQYCPGEAFPWQALWSYLQGDQKPMPHIPDGWEDDGKTLTAPNKEKVVLGFREYILNDSTWPAANWPLEAEHYANPLEASNPALGDGQLQTFRLGRLEWTKKRGVFACWIGQELLKVQAELNALKKP